MWWPIFFCSQNMHAVPVTRMNHSGAKQVHGTAARSMKKSGI
jgi:hypothetical protein